MQTEREREGGGGGLREGKGMILKYRWIDR